MKCGAVKGSSLMGVGALDGLQLKHTDLARLLRVQDSVEGWIGSGRLVNGMGSGQMHSPHILGNAS